MKDQPIPDSSDTQDLVANIPNTGNASKGGKADPILAALDAIGAFSLTWSTYPEGVPDVSGLELPPHPTEFEMFTYKVLKGMVNDYSTEGESRKVTRCPVNRVPAWLIIKRFQKYYGKVSSPGYTYKTFNYLKLKIDATASNIGQKVVVTPSTVLRSATSVTLTPSSSFGTVSANTEWYIDDVFKSKGATYSLASADFEKRIKVKVVFS